MRGTPSAGPRAARVLCEWSWRLRSCSSPLILKRISRCALDTLTSLGTSGSGHGGALVGHIHVPAGRGPIVLADRHHVGQRPAHQVQHVRVLWIQQVCISNKPPQTPVWPALERRRALAVSRAPPGPPPRGEPCLQLRPSVRAGGKRDRFLFSRILFKMTVWGLSETWR